jgi:hypothetical protein
MTLGPGHLHLRLWCAIAEDEIERAESWVVRSMVLIDLRASQENALLKRTQLACGQGQHTDIKVGYAFLRGSDALYTAGSGSNFPALPSEGAKSRAEAASRITWAAVNRRGPNLSVRGRKNQFCPVARHYPR